MALTGIHFAANIVDPKFNGDCLSAEEQIAGTEYIDELATMIYGTDNSIEVIGELAQYRAKENVFGKAYVIKSATAVDAVTWWKGTCFGLKLGRVATRILTMPPTSAATERSFSTYSIVHTAKRNKLTVERAGKLTYVYHNIKLSNLHLKSSTNQVEVQEATGEKEEGNKDNEQEEIEFVGNEETYERGREDEEVESMSDEVVDSDVGSEEDDDDEEV